MRAPARRERAGRRLDPSKTLVCLNDVPSSPELDVGERHDVAVPLEPDRALEFAFALPAAPRPRLFQTRLGACPRDLAV